MASLEFQYFFDPLCGWCYASAPAVHELAEEYGDNLKMMPVGMFLQPRPISAIADFAWKNDQRIGELTGQKFSQAYHDNVLKALDGVFSSGALTVAMTALGQVDSRLEPQFMRAAQIARYVDGRDTCQISEVVRVAETVAAEQNVPLDAAEFGKRLEDDAELMQTVQARIMEGQAGLQAIGKTGVPQLLMQAGERAYVFGGEALYGGREVLLSTIRRHLN